MDDTAASALARPLTGVRAGDRATVGGKGASLGELTAAGIAVPPGFVVTTAAFARALEALDPGGAARRALQRLAAGDHGAITRATAELRDRVAEAPLPDDVARAITDGYRDLAGDAAAAAAVAVRSSATSEDSADASFAGLADTYLWVRGDAAVRDHVRRCWASLYAVESVAYRRRLGVPEDGLAMAVVVQHMVDADVSGVMFTCSPVTGDRSVVALEAAWGLGSAVVGGEVTPDRYLVSKVTGDVVERAVASKLRRQRMAPGGSGVVSEEVPADLRDRPCLDDAQLRALVGIARRVEDHYGPPQDIEWAIPAGGGILVLQSRPETAWSARARAPVARPRRRAFDHVIDLLSGGADGGAAP